MVCAEEQIVFNRHGLENKSPFRHMGYTHGNNLFRTASGYIRTIIHDTPAARFDKAGDCPEKRGFAGAVGAYQGNYLSPVDMERNPFNSMYLAIIDIDVFQHQQRFVTHHPLQDMPLLQQRSSVSRREDLRPV